MQLVQSHGLVYVQVHQVASKLISCNGSDFVAPVPALRFRDLRDVGRVITSENWDKKKKVFHIGCHLFSSYLSGAYIFHIPPFLGNIPVEALLIVLHIPCQIQPLAFLIQSLHIQAASLHYPQDVCPWFCCIFFSLFSLTRKVLLNHAGLMPFLPYFLNMWIERPCAPRKKKKKKSLKSCQLCSALLSL